MENQTLTPALVSLSPAESEQFTALEQQVHRGFQSFGQAGQALGVIKEQKLYRASFSNFDTYLRERWGLSKSHGVRLIAASQTLAALQADAKHDWQLLLGKNPVTESVLRPLSVLPIKKRPLAFTRAFREAGHTPTARHVQAQVDRIRPRRQPAPLPTDPADRAQALQNQILHVQSKITPRTRQMLRDSYKLKIADLKRQLQAIVIPKTPSLKNSVQALINDTQAKATAHAIAAQSKIPVHPEVAAFKLRLVKSIMLRWPTAPAVRKALFIQLVQELP